MSISEYACMCARNSVCVSVCLCARVHVHVYVFMYIIHVIIPWDSAF